MASKKRAALNPELLAARAAKRATKAARSGLERDDRGGRAKPTKATPACKKPRTAKARATRKPSTQPAANSNIVPVSAIAAQNAFARTGAASAAAFRPWYWRY
jgi:hypothetical protein